MGTSRTEGDGTSETDLRRIARVMRQLEPADFELTDPPPALWERIELALVAPTTSTVVEYVIDADDGLVEVGGDWAAFATENQAPELAIPPGGRSLWDAAGDDELGA